MLLQAEEVYWRMPPEILTSICNDSVSFLCKRECFPAALEVYILMRLKGLTVWSKSYYILLKSLINSRNGLIVEMIFCDVIKACRVFEPRMVNIICLYLCKKKVEEAIHFLAGLSKRNISLGVLTVVVNTLKEKGRVQEALDFLLEAEESTASADEVVYSILVDGFCKVGSLEKALYLCSNMRKMGITPNIATYNSVMHGLCREGCLVEAFRVFDSLECNGLFPTVVTYATLIDALSREGFLQDAKHLLGRMAIIGISPNIRILNSLINGYCIFGLLEEGIKLFKDLAGCSFEPDGLTISSLIYGYCTKVEEGNHYFNSMRSVHGIEPGPDHYTCMVDLFGHADLLQEALNLINSSPDGPHSAAWGALLSATGQHLNCNMAKFASDIPEASMERKVANFGNIENKIFDPGICFLQQSLFQ
ncbi:Pentatricopeptide repeat-containing protein [Dendrobium catenatum]|uniref:Pentatricopeptide repeat-containing protein n=1 Tax=Dendrobium catenatum TaxID=906689 RepID=A0A2I0VSN6_9ASPA|nr:Pentatricopeptide repeat-containing protein [Dendrobium catenatum]